MEAFLTCGEARELERTPARDDTRNRTQRKGFFTDTTLRQSGDERRRRAVEENNGPQMNADGHR